MAARSSEHAIDELKRIRYECYLNGHYHADREAVLDSRHRWLMLAVVVLGASSIVDLFPKDLRAVLGGATAVIGAIDLSFGYSIRARAHAYLRREYFRIASKLEKGELDIKQARACLDDIAAEEEPPFMAAHALSANWAHRTVYGNGTPPNHVGFWQNILRHVIRFSDSTFTSLS